MTITIDKEKIKEVNVGEKVCKAVEVISDIGMGSLYWQFAKAVTAGMNPVLGFCVKAMYGAGGAAIGKCCSSFICGVFDIEDKVNEKLGIEVKEEEAIEEI